MTQAEQIREYYTDYDLGATKDWLPKSKEFDDWVGYSPSMAQVVIAVYLIYRGN